jgi:hypothetical protein
VVVPRGQEVWGCRGALEITRMDAKGKQRDESGFHEKARCRPESR